MQCRATREPHETLELFGVAGDILEHHNILEKYIRFVLFEAAPSDDRTVNNDIE
jgi:hypothetical protein